MKIAAFIPLIALAACAIAPPPSSDGIAGTKIGQTINLGGPKVTVLEVLEDSRCPAEVDCAWPGQVKLSVRIELGSGAKVAELISNQPLAVADGQLELTKVLPIRSNTRPIAPQDYRFTLRFNGGL